MGTLLRQDQKILHEKSTILQRVVQQLILLQKEQKKPSLLQLQKQGTIQQSIIKLHRDKNTLLEVTPVTLSSRSYQTVDLMVTLMFQKNGASMCFPFDQAAANLSAHVKWNFLDGRSKVIMYFFITQAARRIRLDQTYAVE